MIEEVSDDGTAVIEQKNKFCVGDEIEIMKPDGRNVPVKVTGIKDEEGNPMESAPHSKQKLFVSFEPGDCEQYDILRCGNRN